MVYCYSCGKQISKKEGTETREHIPAQNLFAGYGDEYKQNRIVVPACLACNGESTAVDEEFRNLIGTISNFSELNTISANTAKAIITRNRQFDRLALNNTGSIRAVQFDRKLIIDNHIKIFKGLFYYQYKRPLPKEYAVMAQFEPNDLSGSAIRYLDSNFTWKHSGHPDVFDYIVQPFREGIVNPEKKDLVAVESESYYVGLMRYNKSHAAIAIATNQEIKKPR